MGISFDQTFALLLLAPVMGSTIYLWRRSRRGQDGPRARVILALRLLLITLLVLVVAAPSVRYTVNRQAVVFVADLSASVQQQRARVEEFVIRAMEARGEHDRAGIVAIGREALVEWPVTERGGFRHLQSEVHADNTNLADGLRLGAALLPPDARRRVVVISDGRENLGDAVEQARFLRAQGVQVDVALLEGYSGAEILIASVDAPSSANMGERVPVEVTVVSTLRAEGSLRLSVDGAAIAEREISLDVGETRFAIDVGIDSPGFHTLRATVESDTDTQLQNNRADAFVNVHGPMTVLVVEDRKGAAKNVSQALAATGLRAEVVPTALFPESLEELGGFAAVVLVDVPAGSLGQNGTKVIRAAVRDLGKGLVAVGGPHSFTMGDYLGTPLEDVLPVTSEVPERKETGKVALVLVIDKSGSMASAGPDGVAKVEMAKEAARLSLEQLEPYDLAGVVAFDAQQWWLVPIGEIGSDAHLKETQEAIGVLVADGGTDIYPAMNAAYLGLVDAPAPRRHMVLLTDGNSQLGDYRGLLSIMREAEITVSTIGIGADVDVDLLQWLAEEGGGRFYFSDRARDIPQVLTKETRLAARHAIVEEPSMPLVAGRSPILRATGGEFPTLGGYVTTLPRNSAQVVLMSPKGDPILAQWQYGLGRSIAWTSDSEGRWTGTLNAWERSPAFWSTLVEWTLPPEEAAFQMRADVKAGVASLSVEGDAREGAQLSARIVGPELDAIELPLRATALERYETEFPAHEQGSYLVEIVEEGPHGERRSTTAGLVVPYSPEYGDLGGNSDLMQSLAAITNGRVLDDPSESFAPGLPPAYGDVPLAWWLLVAAVLLLPLDIALRRLNVPLAQAVGWLAAARGWLLGASVSRAPETPSPVLAGVRQRRAGRLGLRLGDPDRRERGATEPASSPGGQTVQPRGEDPGSRNSQPSPLEREQEESETSTERWLRAKRRARNR